MAVCHEEADDGQTPEQDSSEHYVDDVGLRDQNNRQDGQRANDRVRSAPHYWPPNGSEGKVPELGFGHLRIGLNLVNGV